MKPLIILMLLFSFEEAWADSFKEGCYYDKEGKKIEGLIKFNRATFSAFGSKPGNIKFKPKEKSKDVKLTAEDILAFVIGEDSFAVVYNFKINTIHELIVKEYNAGKQ